MSYNPENTILEIIGYFDGKSDTMRKEYEQIKSMPEGSEKVEAAESFAVSLEEWRKLAYNFCDAVNDQFKCNGQVG